MNQDDMDRFARDSRRQYFASLIARGGGVQAIGGHLILVVSDEPPPNRSHVVYVPLATATPDIIMDAVDRAERPELVRVK